MNVAIRILRVPNSTKIFLVNGVYDNNKTSEVWSLAVSMVITSGILPSSSYGLQGYVDHKDVGVRTEITVHTNIPEFHPPLKGPQAVLIHILCHAKNSSE